MGKASRGKKHTPGAKKSKPPASRKGGIPPVLGELNSFILTLFLVTAAAILIYSETFSYPFVFDDVENIIENYRLRDPASFWPPSGTRDIGFLTFALNYRFGGLEVFGYHLVNTLIHIINALLVWSVVVFTFRTPQMVRSVSRMQTRYLIALTASLIFVTHPLQTQAVIYVVQRFASLATLFYLLSVVLYIKARLCVEGAGTGTRSPVGGVWGVKTLALGTGAFLSAVLSMKTKEISFTLPFIILLYECMFFDSKIFTPKRLLFLVPIFSTALLIPLSIVGVDKPVGDVIGELGEAARETETIPRGVYLTTQFRVITTYIRLLFMPLGQNLDYDYPHYYSFFTPGVFFSFVFLVALFGLSIYLYALSRRTGSGHQLLTSFGILWFFITLSVESSVVPIRDVIFEHRVYLPSVGAVVAFSAAAFYGFDYVGERRGVKRISPVLMACVLLLVTALPMGIGAYKRNQVWSGWVTLWEDVVRKSPEKARGHNNLGLAYKKAGLRERELKEYMEAVRIEPEYAEAYANIGNVYVQIGRTDEAIEKYKEALRLKPGLVTAHYNLGRAYAIKGRTEEAVKEYAEVLVLKPEHARTHLNLGNIYLKQGRTEEAVKKYRLALTYNPALPRAHNNLGLVYFRQNRLDEAIREYTKAIRLEPDYANAHLNLGSAYYGKGLTDEAIREYTEAIRLEPDFTDAHFNLGQAYRRKGLRNEAIREFEKTLKIKPDHEKARKILETLPNDN
jgi:tetratricopeptide (TPR) repeat protein